VYEIKQGDIDYCDWLCRKFHAYRGRKPTEDHIQDAREGLCEAAKRWDETKARTFISYARWWIFGYVERNYANRFHYSPKFPDRVYMRSNDVYYQNRQENIGFDYYSVQETTHVSCEAKDMVNKITATMPLDIEFALRMQSRGVPIKTIINHLGLKTSHQAFRGKISRWRNRNKEYINDLNGITQTEV